MPTPNPPLYDSGRNITARHHRVLVWDLPTRIFHWLLVLLVAVSYYTGKTGGTLMQYHEWSGVAILVLVLFRLLWGFMGGGPSRFRAFLRGPRQVLAYARALLGGQGDRYLGHNPLGGWSIIAMLAALVLQAATGLFANDDIFTEGPLAQWVSKGASDWLTGIHRLNQNILIGLVALHLAAVLFHLAVKRENLITPMVTGCKSWHEAAAPAAGGLVKAFVLAAVLAGAVYGLIYGL